MNRLDGVGEREFFKQNRDFLAVGRRPVIKLKHAGLLKTRCPIPL
jgi:hypothetical protein